MTLYLGCPIWTSKEWMGSFLPSGTSARDSLAAYSRRLMMVEGNTTFYGMPSQELVARWRDDTPGGFRFCLKFPRVISHDKQLFRCEAETEEWLACLYTLEDRAGASFLQLPPEFGPDRLPLLTAYLKALPSDLSFALEPRHPGWFQKDTETGLNTLLSDLGIARVLYDVRPLRAADPKTPGVVQAQQTKPQVPVRVTRTADTVFVRYISHPDVGLNEAWLAQWAPRVAEWLQEACDVYFCMHSIYDKDMPVLCRNFHAQLSELVPLPPLPDWQSDVPDSQLSLFG